MAGPKSYIKWSQRKVEKKITSIFQNYFWNIDFRTTWPNFGQGFEPQNPQIAEIHAFNTYA